MKLQVGDGPSVLITFGRTIDPIPRDVSMDLNQESPICLNCTAMNRPIVRVRRENGAVLALIVIRNVRVNVGPRTEASGVAYRLERNRYIFFHIWSLYFLNGRATAARRRRNIHSLRPTTIKLCARCFTCLRFRSQLGSSKHH